MRTATFTRALITVAVALALGGVLLVMGHESARDTRDLATGCTTPLTRESAFTGPVGSSARSIAKAAMEAGAFKIHWDFRTQEKVAYFPCDVPLPSAEVFPTLALRHMDGTAEEIHALQTTLRQMRRKGEPVSWGFSPAGTFRIDGEQHSADVAALKRQYALLIDDSGAPSWQTGPLAPHPKDVVKDAIADQPPPPERDCSAGQKPAKPDPNPRGGVHGAMRRARAFKAIYDPETRSSYIFFACDVPLPRQERFGKAKLVHLEFTTKELRRAQRAAKDALWGIAAQGTGAGQGFSRSGRILIETDAPPEALDPLHDAYPGMFEYQYSVSRLMVGTVTTRTDRR